MAGDLSNTGKGNLFVIFGEPDIDILPAEGSDTGGDQIKVRINGVDVFHPNTGEVRSHNADGIACWFVDTDYDQESFFVRHAYFLGKGDPYKALKTTLKAEINEEAWSTLCSNTSRPFAKPQSGRIAIKVINHLGDEGYEGLQCVIRLKVPRASTCTLSLTTLHPSARDRSDWIGKRLRFHVFLTPTNAAWLKYVEHRCGLLGQRAPVRIITEHK